MNFILDFIVILFIVFIFNFIGQKYINDLAINWSVFTFYVFFQTLLITLLLTFVF